MELLQFHMMNTKALTIDMGTCFIQSDHLKTIT